MDDDNSLNEDYPIFLGLSILEIKKIAEDIFEKSGYKKWSFIKDEENVIKMTSRRTNNIPGTHVLKYSSEIDSIEIKHIAKNRKGFAMGAVIAAEWIINKKGVFEMEDVINDFKI